MPNLKMIDQTGKEVGQIELNDEIFAVKPNKALLHQAVVQYLANQRQGTQSALTRAEVKGGGKKPWRQKGTGRARHGSTRAPQWTHGGVAFAPKPRSYSKDMNRKAKRLALKSALSAKVKDDSCIVLDKLELNECKTKAMVQVLGDISAAPKSLIIMPSSVQTVVKSANNIPGVKTTIVGTLTVYDILNAQNIILTEDSIKLIEEVYA
jgi:large subunit ribosomal protein L4